MSLKGFHILFISFAILTAFGFFVWTRLAGDEFVSDGLRGIGMASAALGLGLLAYGGWFVKKSRKIIT